MSRTAAPDSAERTSRRRIHRAWWVAAVILGALVAAAGFRSSTGALLEPLESEFGWDRATTSGAVTVNLVLYGLTAPFAAALMERFGIRRVVAASLLLVAAGSGLTVLMTEAWQLWLLWGLAVGIGTGAMALVLGAIVANRWFVESRRGLVTGVFSAAGAAGQLVFLPGIAALAEGPGWRYAALVVTVAAVLLVPLVLVVVRDHPADVGLRPLGAPTDQPLPAEDGGPAEPATRHTGAARLAVRTLAESTRSRTFWILVGTFWICGWSTNGLIGTHFIPAAHDHGMPQTTAAGLLALIGVFDMVGTVASGWLTDKVDPRWLLFGYYGLRGLSLLFVPAPARPGHPPQPVPLHRLLRPGLGGHRAADHRAVPAPLRGRPLGRGVRLGLRLAHGRRGGGGELCGLGAQQHRRLPDRVAHRRRTVRAGRLRLPRHQEDPGPHVVARGRRGVRGRVGGLRGDLAMPVRGSPWV